MALGFFPFFFFDTKVMNSQCFRVNSWPNDAFVAVGNYIFLFKNIKCMYSMLSAIWTLTWVFQLKRGLFKVWLYRAPVDQTATTTVHSCKWKLRFHRWREGQLQPWCSLSKQSAHVWNQVFGCDEDLEAINNKEMDGLSYSQPRPGLLISRWSLRNVKNVGEWLPPTGTQRQNACLFIQKLPR